jgi:hypothetical protein
MREHASQRRCVYIYELHFNGGREKSFVDGFAPTASINAWKQATGFY